MCGVAGSVNGYGLQLKFTTIIELLAFNLQFTGSTVLPTLSTLRAFLKQNEYLQRGN